MNYLVDGEKRLICFDNLYCFKNIQINLDNLNLGIKIALNKVQTSEEFAIFNSNSFPRILD